ncbi:Phenolic glucoside malonyltransferase [Quillaja saponaria]|uniref:Phenolic glucoside malonyltransferase n=1 Tax=Quillaja saponaria TaxID=32244 RepID=A0AAD7VFU0_QUISA|nr:Phenolic glucoside malonyltransferase [Quillaja saponaria]
MYGSTRNCSVLEVCQITPPPETTTNYATPTSLPLTFFDIHWLRLPPVQELQFYEFTHPTPTFFDSVLPKLKHSLSLTLQYFLPLTGNFIWPHGSHKPIISYSPEDSVSFTIAESNACFIHLSGTDLSEATEIHPLIPQLAISDEKASVFAVQVTLFPNSGFSIGFAIHHAILDGITASVFRKSWAHICKLQDLTKPLSLLPSLMPFYDRSIIKDSTRLEAIYVEEWLKQGGPNNRSLKVWDLKVPEGAIRGIFELTHKDIENLRQSVLAKQNGKFQHLSKFTLICAYIWICIVKAEKTKGENVGLVFSVDCRPRMEPPIPSTYFGNCVAGKRIEAETKTLIGEDGLVTAVEAITKGLTSLETDGVLSGADKWVSMLSGITSGRTFAIAGSSHFDVYNIDYGWGSPKKVEMASIDRTGAICLFGSRNGNGGVQIGLVLKKHEMEAFATLFVEGLESLSDAGAQGSQIIMNV